MNKTSIRWGENEELSLELPSHWQVVGRHSPRISPPIEDVRGSLSEALARPLSRDALVNLLAGVKRVALVVDDLTRPTPAGQLLGPVVDLLEKVGISDQQISGVVATGLHPGMNREQLIEKVGERFAGRFKWLQNDCRNSDRYDWVGTTEGLADSGGSENGKLDVHLLREVAQADLVLLFGSVSPHVQAGFGGGNKLLFPGCARADMIGALHKFGLNGQVDKLIGQEPAKNPMRQVVEQAAKLLGDKTFLISVLLDSAGRATDLAAGDPKLVHQQLAKTCRRDYGLEISEQADVVLVSAFPRDYDLLQGFKCIANTRLAAKEGGVIIGMLNLTVVGHLMLESKLGITPPAGVMRFFMKLLGVGRIVKVAALTGKGLDEEAKFFLRLALETINRNRVLAYCPELVRTGGSFPCVESFDQMQTIWARADKLLGRPRQVRVNVFTEGGVTYPVVPS